MVLWYIGIIVCIMFFLHTLLATKNFFRVMGGKFFLGFGEKLFILSVGGGSVFIFRVGRRAFLFFFMMINNNFSQSSPNVYLRIKEFQ